MKPYKSSEFSIIYLSLVLVLFFTGREIMPQLPAFPGAEGYGQFATGGRYGVVVQVTNLDDDGPGSLRAALKMKVPRIVVFRISGTIKLLSELEVNHGNLTIAGQTAPGDGICITGNRTALSANNIIIRFIRFRLGDETKIADDAISAMNCKDIIIDHCSMSWGIDEVASFYDNENFTLQWCIISEALNNSVHPKGEHGYGGIWGGVNATFHHNLLAHNQSRNPRFNGARTGTSYETELVDFRNNVIYNWGANSSYGGEKGKQNIVGNYYKSGTSSHNKSRIVEPLDDEGKWFIDKNWVEGYKAISEDNWQGGVQGDYADQSDIKSSEPFGINNIVTHSALEAYNKVLKFAGALYPKRDAVDERILCEVKKTKVHAGSGIINSQTEVGGFPEYNTTIPPPDTDQDGMPDDWEVTNKLNPNDNKDANTSAPDGYTYIEYYLNGIVKDAFDGN